VSRNLQFVVGEYYHVYNRGVDKRIIFNDEFDYQRFLLLLLLANDQEPIEVKQLVRTVTIPKLLQQARQPLVSILAFSLMSNHYHLVLKEITDNGISKFMHKLGTGYSVYFNLRNDRSGALFQGTFKAKHAHDDRYLTYLFEYIHLNPVRENLEAGAYVAENLISVVLENPFTSLRVYAGKEKGRIAEAILNQADFYSVVNSYDDHVKKLSQWNYSALEGGLASL
jgi:putative transposase